MRTKAMQCSYSEEIELAKLRTLTALFREAFGYQPLSFRAGRFGARPYTLVCLAQLGYLVDTSVTPGINWVLPEGAARFRGAPTQPYFPDPADITRQGSSCILEVPVTIHAGGLARLAQATRGDVLQRGLALAGLGPTWLRPSYSSVSQMRRLLDLMCSNSPGDMVVANMMFHSVEFVPGASPYCRTQRDCDHLLGKLDATLKYAAERGFKFSRLSDLYRIYQSPGTARI
ncbi:MAG: hypothetical protein QXP27_10125 [Candidatus Methanomethyliaceae archaeon]